jgi:hypothetical protein
LTKGKARLVPFDVVRLYWGDPRSIKGAFGRVTDERGNFAGDVAPREQEVRRLTALYGLHTESPLLADVVAKVTITNGDDLEIFTPAIDPEGEHIYGVEGNDAPVYDAATKFAKLEREMAIVKEQLAAEQRNGKNDGADVADDSPRRPAR